MYENEREDSGKLTSLERIHLIGALIDEIAYCHSRLGLFPNLAKSMSANELENIERALMPLLEAGSIGIEARNRLVAFISDIVEDNPFNTGLKKRFWKHVKNYSGAMLSQGTLPPIEYVYVLQYMADSDVARECEGDEPL